MNIKSSDVWVVVDDRARNGFGSLPTKIPDEIFTIKHEALHYAETLNSQSVYPKPNYIVESLADTIDMIISDTLRNENEYDEDPSFGV